MRNAQFIKIKTAPLSRSTTSRGTGSRGSIKRWPLSRLANEAARVPEHSAHVRHPAKPIVLSGCAPEKIVEAFKAKIASRQTEPGKRRKKLRADQHIAICVVMSYPVPKEILETDADEMQKFHDWAKLADRQQDAYWGERGAEPISTVIHIDEKSIHLHKFLSASLIPSFSARAIHPGCIAWKSTYEETRDKDAAKDAYNAAMTEFQDRFFLEVSSKFGHDRFGDRYVRMTRADAIRANDRERTELRLLEAKELEFKRRAEILARQEAEIAERLKRLRMQRARAAIRLRSARAKLRMLRIAAKSALIDARQLQTRLTAALGALPRFLSSLADRCVDVARNLGSLPSSIESSFGSWQADKAHSLVNPLVNDLHQLSSDLRGHLEIGGPRSGARTDLARPRHAVAELRSPT